ELNIERSKVAFMRLLHSSDEFFFADASLASADHDRGAVRVVGAHINTPIADQLLEANPDIGLDVLHQMANVDIAISVGQGGSDEDSTHGRDSENVLKNLCKTRQKTGALAASIDGGEAKVPGF